MPRTTLLVLVGSPDWADTLSEALPDDTALTRYTDRDRYVMRLTDDHAAMIIVDGNTDDWRYFTTTPKANNATRRIPIVLVADNEAVRAEALTSGADFALPPDDLPTRLSTLISDHARTVDPVREEQLACECDQPLPPLAVQGVEKFNNREFYPQHDLFEEQWMETEGPVRDLYRAVLQVGVAYYQVERGNHRGALKMLLRAVQWLEVLPDVCQTINVKQLRQDAYRVREELEHMNPDDIDQFDTSLLKPVQRVEK